MCLLDYFMVLSFLAIGAFLDDDRCWNIFPNIYPPKRKPLRLVCRLIVIKRFPHTRSVEAKSVLYDESAMTPAHLPKYPQIPSLVSYLHEKGQQRHVYTEHLSERKTRT